MKHCKKSIVLPEPLSTFLSGIILLTIVSILFSCHPEQQPEEPGKIHFIFQQREGDNPLIYDSMMYENAAGNAYLVNEIQYFVSDVKIYRQGTAFSISDPVSYHYVDTDIQSSWDWIPGDTFQAGIYDSIGFTFGFADKDNISFRFSNPPESNMFWPEPLGGGYHYMKLNGKWLSGDGTVKPFNFHLGRGQIYGEDTTFVDNSFRVNLPASSFRLAPGDTINIAVIMNIEQWFKDPHIINFDSIGGQIMQNQEAMNMAKENGHNVFSVSFYQLESARP